MTKGNWTTSDGVIRSPDGYEVTPLGRAGYRYADSYGEHFVDGEMLMGDPDAVIIAASIVRLKDGERHGVSAKRRREIAERIKQALESQGLVAVIS